MPAPDCADLDARLARPLALPELVEIALCRDPGTAAAWAATRAAAAREGQARAAYGPRFDASIGPDVGVTRRFGGGFPASTDSSASAAASLSIGWLLFDFGGREARLAGAEAGRLAALADFASQAQATVLETGLAYNDVLAAIEAEDAARANLAFARVSLESATARERAGLGIRSDTLQADTAAAQATLALRQAEGARLTAEGRLASAIGVAPSRRLALQPPAGPVSTTDLLASADALIEQASRLRPDLELQSANVRIAEANVDAARAARRPSVSLGAGPAVNVGTSGQDIASASAGITMSIPLGDSGGRTFAVAEAEAEADRARFRLSELDRAARLDVWSRYQAFATDVANLETARRALDSASEAARLAQGRFRAGVGTLTELLNAQASLASAREQQVSAAFGVRSSRLRLANAVGTIGERIE